MYHNRFSRSILVIASPFLLATVASTTTAIAAAPPKLVVPCSDTVLHIARPLGDDIKLAPARSWQLVEDGQGGVAVPAQLLPAITEDGSAAEGRYRVAAAIPPAKDAVGTRRFVLQIADTSFQPKAGLRFVDVDDKSVRLDDDDKPVLVYNHGVITGSNVPEDNHERYRSCYVHPVWGIGGEVLTDDFPKDHVHHHGLFWAWPHVKIGDQHYDLWTYGDIHDEFVRWICRESGPVAATLAVENGWFVGEKKVMIERVWLRSYAISDDARVLDLEFTWIPTDQPITLRSSDNSYGGLAMRFAVKMPESMQTPTNVVLASQLKEIAITTPNGRADGDQENVRQPWADLSSPFAGGNTRSGAAIFVDPSQSAYPPTWLLRHFGAICVGYPGPSEKTFEPGKPIRLTYRIWIHKRAVDVEDIQRAYDGYATALEVNTDH